MPFLSDAQLDKRKNSSDNLVNRIANISNESTLELHEIKKGGKGPNTVDIPPEIRQTLAVLAHTDEEESQRDIAKVFDVREDKVSLAKHGQTSHLEHSESLQRVIDRVAVKRAGAEEQAIDSLVHALGIIPDKIDGIRSVKTLTIVAKGMAEISEKMRGKVNTVTNDNSQQVHLHIYAPKMKTLEDYDVVDV